MTRAALTKNWTEFFSQREKGKLRNKILVFTTDTCKNRAFGNAYAWVSIYVNYFQLQGRGRGWGGVGIHRWWRHFTGSPKPPHSWSPTPCGTQKVGKSFLKHETALINGSGLKWSEVSLHPTMKRSFHKWFLRGNNIAESVKSIGKEINNSEYIKAVISTWFSEG